MGFCVVFHHMGKFVKNRRLHYLGGEKHVVKKVESNV